MTQAKEILAAKVALLCLMMEIDMNLVLTTKMHTNEITIQYD